MASPVKRVVDDIETADEVPQNKMEQEATEVIEYVAPPPEELTCSICLQVLCDPTLTSCCGQHFCRGCIDRVMARGHMCPLCNEKGFQTFLDKATLRKVRELKVYCKLKVKGCGWVGELGALERHLDVANGSCEFVDVECEFSVIGCVGKMPRRDRESHSCECMHKHLLLMTRWSLKTIDGFQEKSREQRAQLKEALARHDVRKQLEQQRLQFKEELEQQRVEFEEKLEKQHVQFEKKFERHHAQFEEKFEQQRIQFEEMAQRSEKQLNLIEQKMGAQSVLYEEKLTTQRVQFEEQLQKQRVEIKSQMELQQSEYQKRGTQQTSDFAMKLEKLSLDFQCKEQNLREGFEKQRKLDQEHLKSEFQNELGLKEKQFGEHLQQKGGKIAEHQRIQLLTSIPPPEFTMTYFAARKKDNDGWYSPPFYSHPRGYKLCLSVDANGSGTGKGTHVSVYVLLMRGEFDDQLQWPLRGNITIQLLNQRGGGATGNAVMTITYDDSVPDSAAGRVVGRERTEIGHGYGKFTAHYDLAYNAMNNTQYLLNDCLRFRVSMY